MATSRDEVFRAALQLDDSGRAELVGVLLDSLDTESEPGVEAAWVSEIERRIRELDTGAVKAISWADARAQLHGS